MPKAIVNLEISTWENIWDGMVLAWEKQNTQGKFETCLLLMTLDKALHGLQ